MYDSFFNQAFQIGHYMFSFVLLFIVCPRLLFPRVTGDNGERFFADFTRAAVLYILLGYVLVIVKLFEVLALIMILAAAIFWRMKRTQGGRFQGNLDQLEARFYDLLDSGYKLRQLLDRIRVKNAINQAAKETKTGRMAKRFFSGRLWDAPLLFVLGASAYVRFYDSVHYAATPMADSYVTLEWMKFIIRRVLFETGIYPQGFHITLAYLQKFSSIDTLYVLKYTGPLCGLLTVYGLYVTVSRLTGSKGGGVVAAAIYGIGGESLLLSDWERQAATNSQEFAFLFVLPTLYFTFRYMETGEKRWLWTCLAGYSVIGLVHTFAYGYAVMGVAAVVLAFLLTNRPKAVLRTAMVTAAGAVSVLISVLPLGAGLLLGKSLHSATAQFLTERIVIAAPKLQVWDFAGCIAIAFLIVAAVLMIRNRQVSAVFLFGGIFGLATFLFYEYGGAATQSLLIASRSGNLWAISLPFCVGMACGALFRTGGGSRWMLSVETAASLGCAFFLAWNSSLAPVAPYKMQWESEVRQFIKINEAHRPMTWMLITSHVEGYGLSLGKGYHQYIDFLYKNFDPSKPYLTRWDASEPERLPYNLYLVFEKEIFRVSPSMSFYPILKPQYEEREAKVKKLVGWLDVYLPHHPETEIYYEDEHIMIYRLFPKKEDAGNQRIWGEDEGNG